MTHVTELLLRICLFGVLLVVLRSIYQYIIIALPRNKLIRRYGCKDAPRYPQKDPFLGLDIIRDGIRAVKTNCYLARVEQQYKEYGNTFSFRFGTSVIINTNEPENIKTVLVTKSKDYGIGWRRKYAFSPLLGNSIILTDGAQWEHSRALLRPSFTRDQINDLSTFEVHVARLIQAIPRNGSTVDLSGLFYRLTADVTTDVFFGESIQSLIEPKEEVMKALHDSMEGGELRYLFGGIYSVIPQRRFYAAIKEVNDWIDGYVDRAMSKHASLAKENEEKQSIELPAKDSERHVLLRELCRTTDDRDLIRDEILSAFVGGRDTTGGLLGNLFFMLARKPDLWKRLRSEVEYLGGKAPTAGQLRSLSLVRNCVKECKYSIFPTATRGHMSLPFQFEPRSHHCASPALRLHPASPTNARTAYQDTIIPLGGGSDGNSPIFVPAGTTISWHVSALHRRKDLWGEDADEFRAERWEHEREGWVSLSSLSLSRLLSSNADRHIAEIPTLQQRPKSMHRP